jgi:proline iminopeptidase
VTAGFPEIAPYESGMLDVGDGNAIYWESCGNPAGKPAVVLHGGPGSGCGEFFRRFFDPDGYRIVLFDQRNCGRSTPHASEPTTDLTSNTTASLVADIESLRDHLGIELGLAYAEAHAAHVTELILFGVTTGRHSEWDWPFRGGLALFFPEQWARLEAAVADVRDDDDMLDTYHRLLGSPDAATRERAAEAWCLWESATPDWPPKPGLAERFRDPRYAVAFARIVTHYALHDGFLADGVLLRGATALAETPGVLISGRFDFQAPIANAWVLKQAWPRAELVIVDEAGHGIGGGIDDELVRATQRFAKQ